jgi:hypothetical protein
MKSTGVGRDYPGGHKGSLYSGNTNKTESRESNYSGDKSLKSNDKSDYSKCQPWGYNLHCPPGTKCPDGTSDISKNPDFVICTPDFFTGKGVSSGDIHTGYNSKGYPTGSGRGGVYGYGVYRDDDSADSYGIKSDYTPDYSNKLYKGEYGLLGKLDAQGVTGHGYTPRMEEALAYDSNDNLVPILVSPKRMAVWVNDLKTNTGRFQTTFYDKTMWSRPSYDPYMKRI